MSEEKRDGQIALSWWSRNIGNRDSGHARALSARLRRAGAIEALSERAVQELARDLGLGPGRAADLVRLVCLLAEVRTHDGATLARRLGGAEPALSGLRFQRLLRAEGDELVALMRRAIVIADRRCNVAALAEDLLRWSEGARERWCFHYYGADAPGEDSREKTA